eukprot:575588-Pelagomonas_calceolata.AAC.1
MANDRAHCYHAHVSKLELHERGCWEVHIAHKPEWRMVWITLPCRMPNILGAKPPEVWQSPLGSVCIEDCTGEARFASLGRRIVACIAQTGVYSTALPWQLGGPGAAPLKGVARNSWECNRELASNLDGLVGFHQNLFCYSHACPNVQAEDLRSCVSCTHAPWERVRACPHA